MCGKKDIIRLLIDALYFLLVFYEGQGRAKLGRTMAYVGKG